jgi:spore germination protein GerM
VAARKNNGKNTKNASRKTAGSSSAKTQAAKRPIGLLFWVLFFIVTAIIFLANRNRIQETLESTRILDHLPVSLPRSGGRENAEETEQEQEEPGAPPVAPAPQIVVRPNNAPPADNPSPAIRPTPPPDPDPPAQPQTSRPASGQPTANTSPPAAWPANPRPAENTPPAVTAPPPQPAVSLSPSSQATPPASQPAASAGQERGIYFTRIDAEGTILRTRVARRLPASDSPLMDGLRALMAGPDTEEEQRGLRSLIPPTTRLLSVIVRGSTAYISLSEDFQYNTFGVEGYAAQIRQIIWTATEFSNVKDVQILIEGRRIDYLGEGIWIGSPLSRESL